MRLPIIRVSIQFEEDIPVVRQRVQHVAKLANLPSSSVIHLVTAVSEMARNAFQYAKGGTVILSILEDGKNQLLEVQVEDRGPGIANLDEILEERYRSKTGLGQGVVGARKLVDRFAIESSPKTGTLVTLAIRIPPTAPTVTGQVIQQWVEQLTGGAARSVYEVLQQQNQELMGMMGELRTLNQEIEEKATALEVTNLKLEEEITQRQRIQEELIKAKEAAEAAARTKAEFLANMSHEIRTPLNAIIGMTGLLLDARLETEHRDFVETIRSSGDALLAVINDILDFSKIEAGKLHLEAATVDIRDCIEESLDLLAPKAGEKGLDLAYFIEGECPEAVIGDHTRLRQILVNLVGNAVKFTSEGEVVITTTAKPLDEDRWEVHFAIKDTGIGIPPEQMQRLFQAFSQGDSSTTRHFGGTGLGLVISKRLSEAMGGRIWVESTGVPGEGSTFHITLQGKAAKSDKRTHLLGRQPQLEGRGILIVDDVAVNRLILERQTRGWGMKPHLASSGSEALEAIQSDETFDVAILDMQMPGMDGVTLARNIREHHSAEELPLVLLTSMGQFLQDEDDPIFAASLIKPIKSDTLHSVLSQALGGRPAHFARPAPDRIFDAELGERHPLRILLAEDQVVNQKVALLMLGRLSYRADVAANGLEVLDALNRQTYDVVLMDVQMPEMDGLEASRRIKAELPEDQRPRIVAMTAGAMQEDRQRCAEAGMDDYVSKPVQPEALQAALERCVPLEAMEPANAAATEPTPEPTEATPPVDAADDVLASLEKLQQLGGPEIVGELIDIYLEDTPPLLQSAHQAIEAKDANALQRAAHGIKGSSANLGLSRLADQCFELEKIGKSGSVEGAAPVLEQVQAAYDHACAVLEEARNPSS